MPVDFSIKDFFYPVSLLKMRWFLERSQWFSKERLERYQIKRLRTILNIAYKHSDYYQKIFNHLDIHPNDIKSMDDLKNLPLLTKDDIRANFHSLQTSLGDKYHAKQHSTSGSTGQPVSFLLDKPANVLEFCYYWRHWSWAGYHLGARFGELTPGFFLRHPECKDHIAHLSRLTGRVQLNSLMIGEQTAKKFAEAIRQYKIKFLNGLASTLYYFALLCKKAGINDISFKAIFSQGEMLLPAYRSVIESTFNCKVYDSYGHMERTVGICECPAGGYHINSEYGILEIIPDTKHPDEHVSSGIAVGTSLHNFSMPLVRYVINDRIELDTSGKQCSCCRGLPLIKKLWGRQEDVIMTPDGRLVTDIFTVFEQVPGIELARIEQVDKKEVVVTVARAHDWQDKSELALKADLEQYLGTQMCIEIRYSDVQTLRGDTGGKFKVVISHLKPLMP